MFAAVADIWWLVFYLTWFIYEERTPLVALKTFSARYPAFMSAWLFAHIPMSAGISVLAVVWR